MIVHPELVKVAVVATLAVAPVLVRMAVAQQVGTDNPPPSTTVLQRAYAPGPASERASAKQK